MNNVYTIAFQIAAHFGLVESKHADLARYASRKTEKGLITLAQKHDGHLQLSYVADEQCGDFALLPIALSKEQLSGGYLAVDDMDEQLGLFLNDQVLKPEERRAPDRNARIIDSGYQAYAREEGHYDHGDY